MGYVADVTVSFDKHLKEGQTISEEITEAIGLRLEELGCEYVDDGEGQWYDIKWDSDDEDLIALSKEHPEIIFEAVVEWKDGERGEPYSVYFRNGVSTETASDFGIIDRSEVVYQLTVGDVLDRIKDGLGLKKPTPEQLKEILCVVPKLFENTENFDPIGSACDDVGLEAEEEGETNG